MIQEKGMDRLRVDDVLNGVLSFKVEDGDLAEVGCYRFQVVGRSQGRYLASEIQPFEVMGNL
jgi:hypothetical protein